MKRYLIILIAILAGLIAFALIEKLSRKKEGGITKSHIIGAFVSFITLAIGLFLLEVGAASPQASYVPAKLIDGQIIQRRYRSQKRWDFDSLEKQRCYRS